MSGMNEHSAAKHNHTRTYDGERLLTIEEYAVQIGRSTPTVFRMIRTGALRVRRILGRTFVIVAPA